MKTSLLERPALRVAEVKAAYEKICTYDFSRVLSFLVNRERFSVKKSTDLVEQYKRYMALRVTHTDLNLPISRPVDLVWHTHILDTQGYRQFQNLLGQTIDHVPAITADDFRLLSGPYVNCTLTLLKDHFGEAPPQLWPMNSQICQGPWVQTA